ncbi:hypothetical protein CGZ95_19455 [Enemella evansiae]|uniref:DUF2254 family protein n=1 Tax=Enemella evansiae TaxID=2016499 RepID=UPI000B967F12|nr:DUF2254 family protein [Enemella evansiae]OYN93516.1 hypothetical protein CGZ95_19455 [Enemella evansiae]
MATESEEHRKEWQRLVGRLRIRTMWGVPLILLLAGLALGLALPIVDRLLARVLQPYPGIDSGAIAGILGIVAGATMTLTGLAFSALATAMSIGLSNMSVRIVPLLQQDNVVRWSIGTFLGTFAYVLLIAVSVAAGEDGYQPVAATALAVLLSVLCAVMLLALIARVCQHLNPAMLLHRLVAAGQRGLATDLIAFHQDQPPLRIPPEPLPHPVTRTTPVRHGDTVQAINARRIFDLENEWGIQLELVPRLGSAVAFGGTLFRTSAPLDRDRAADLENAVAFGDTYSPANGLYGTIRAIVDIALKALSPAINDPTRAVQCLDAIEDILARVAPLVREQGETLAGETADDASLSRGWWRPWEVWVSAATDEIRQFGTTSMQIERRLRALFQTLLSICPPDQHPPLRVRLEALDRATSQWSDPLDRSLSGAADVQGIGAPDA